MSIFASADILLPKVDSLEKWAVIACDQFTSQPEYWQRVRALVGDAPSTLRLVLPEAELGMDDDARAGEIDAEMTKLLNSGRFCEYRGVMVYVERTLLSGKVRKGLVGAVDLEAYDYGAGSTSAIRASEKTVVERIPPRKKVRQNAPLELPHVLLLCDDDERVLIEPIAAARDSLPKLYDFDLMEGGGHIAGWLVQGEIAEAFERRLAAYAETVGKKYDGLSGASVLFAVGDGNHSLATAKACYEDQKRGLSQEDALALPSRWALVELENIHDEAQAFEPIHRLVLTEEPEALLARMRREIGADAGYPIQWIAGEKSGTICLDERRGPLPVAILQEFLDAYMSERPCGIDFIHGEEALRQLASREGAVGLMLPAIDKGGLFRGIVANGVLPRKSFSMGHAQEKRYYLEARKIRQS